MTSDAVSYTFFFVDNKLTDRRQEQNEGESKDMNGHIGAYRHIVFIFKRKT